MKMKIFEKKPRLKPLKLGDTMVAFVNQDKTQDRTREYKIYLKQMRKTNNFNLSRLIDQDNNLEEFTVQLQPLIMLPDFIQNSKDQKQLINNVLYLINVTNDRLQTASRQNKVIGNQEDQLIQGQGRRKKSVHFRANNQAKQQYSAQLFPAIQNICKNYEYLLGQITDKLKRTLSNQQTNLLLGKQSIEDLRVRVGQTADSISIKRGMMMEIHSLYKQTNQKIVKKLRKKSALEKVLMAVQLWKSSELQKIIWNKSNQKQLSSIEVLRKIRKTKQSVNIQFQHLQGFQCFRNIIKRIQEKERQIVSRIEDNMLRNVINFSSKQEYIKQYQQYLDYLQFLNNPETEEASQCKNQQVSSLPNCNTHKHSKISIMDDLQALIAENLKYLYTFTLSRTMNSHLGNLQLLNQNSYMIFFRVFLAVCLPKYLQNWHHVTSVHFDLQSGYGQKMVHCRQILFTKMAEMVTNAIKFSNKFAQIEDIYRLKILTYVYNFIKMGQQWAGCKLKMDLGFLLLQKMKKQLQIFFKTGNGQLKGILVSQLSTNSVLQPYKDRSIGELSQGDGQDAQMIQNNEQINLQGIRQLLKDNIKYEKESVGFKRCPDGRYNELGQGQQQQGRKTRKKGMSEELGLVSPTLQFLCKMMKTYTYRSLYMPISVCDYFYEHVELIVFMLYKLCISDQTKVLIYKDVVSQDNSRKLKQLLSTKIKDVSSKELQKELPASVDQLLESYNRKRMYFNIYQLLKGIGSKYDGINASGHINVNKIYQPIYQEYLIPYYKRILRILQDIIKLVSTVILIIKQDHSVNHLNQNKLTQLPEAIKQLLLLIFHQYHDNLQKTYLANAAPALTSLKWEIKKFNQQTAINYKEYKIKFLETFRNSQQNYVHFLELDQLKQLFKQKETQIFYRSLLESYSKIDKINDNGRQLIRVDSIQMVKVLQQFTKNEKIWTHWFQRFLQFTNQRSSKNLLQKVRKVAVFYPISFWRMNIFWVISDFSGREKKQFFQNLLTIYIQQLKQLAQTGML